MALNGTHAFDPEQNCLQHGLCGDHSRGGGLLAFSDLQLAMHLAPDARVTPTYLAAVIDERALQDGGKEAARVIGIEFVAVVIVPV